ncbi:MAG TPA: hypothetical protein VF800_07480 [Telluria sp.]
MNQYRRHEPAGTTTASKQGRFLQTLATKLESSGPAGNPINITA